MDGTVALSIQHRIVRPWLSSQLNNSWGNTTAAGGRMTAWLVSELCGKAAWGMWERCGVRHSHRVPMFYEANPRRTKYSHTQMKMENQWQRKQYQSWERWCAYLAFLAISPPPVQKYRRISLSLYFLRSQLPTHPPPLNQIYIHYTVCYSDFVKYHDESWAAMLKIYDCV